MRLIINIITLVAMATYIDTCYTYAAPWWVWVASIGHLLIINAILQSIIMTYKKTFKNEHTHHYPK
ncbi:MAG: hypothetical protein D6790_00770 [Caldilineae bacterium]|nr:MAG: hypothetical protein D6790_00770 [Caldilineae bacterium]